MTYAEWERELASQNYSTDDQATILNAAFALWTSGRAGDLDHCVMAIKRRHDFNVAVWRCVWLVAILFVGACAMSR